MKKYLVFLIVIALAINISGCKKNQEVINQIDNNEISTGINEVDEKDKKSEEESKNEENVVKVRDDVYEPPRATTVKEINVKSEPTVITDKNIESELKEFINYFYYNYLFNANAEGTISKSDMQLFAISFIYQFEYNELKFDADNFILYIPEENVTEVVKRFFNVDFTEHNTLSIENIVYEDGFYLMPACDVGEKANYEVLEVTKETDFSYKITFKPIIENKPIDEPDEYYEAVIEEYNGRMIMKSYKKLIMQKEESDESN